MTHRPLRTALATAALSLVAGAAFGQVDPLTTTAGLKAACETRPGNAVTISNSITVNQGYPAGYPERVATGCTITLTNGASIQFDKVGLAFAGPLTIGGGTKSGISMQEASLAGTSVALRFSGAEAYLQTSFSRIDATAGNLTVQLPSTSKMELFNYRTDGVPLTRATLAATGSISITGADRLSAAFVEAGIAAGGNIDFLTTSFEPSVKFENGGVLSFGGNVSMRLHGSKGKFEFSNGNVRAPLGNLSITTAFNESSIGLSNVTIEAGRNVVVHAEGTKSVLEVSNGSMVAGGTMMLGAAALLGDSEMKVGNGAYRAATPIQFLSGANGATGVYGATILGTGLVQIATGAGGKCEALLNRITAVTQSVCQ
jgi:hypothetical protein